MSQHRLHIPSTVSETQGRLTEALATGAIPPGYEAQVSAILDEASLPVVVNAVKETASQIGGCPKLRNRDVRSIS